MWASPALPGATHDLTAARHHGIIDALTAAGALALADKAYRGAGRAIRVPFHGRHLPKQMRICNSSLNKTRGPGERANATLKSWRLLTKLRCCPQRATPIVAAILALHHAAEQA